MDRYLFYQFLFEENYLFKEQINEDVLNNRDLNSSKCSFRYILKLCKENKASRKLLNFLVSTWDKGLGIYRDYTINDYIVDDFSDIKNDEELKEIYNNVLELIDKYYELDK